MCHVCICLCVCVCVCDLIICSSLCFPSSARVTSFSLKFILASGLDSVPLPSFLSVHPSLPFHIHKRTITERQHLLNTDSYSTCYSFCGFHLCSFPRALITALKDAWQKSGEKEIVNFKRATFLKDFNRRRVPCTEGTQ